MSILGSFVEANINAKRRSDERIPLNSENIRKLGFNPEKTSLLIEGVPRPCIMKDISFSGTLAVISGLGKFLVDKEAEVQTEFEDYNKPICLKGTVKRFEEVEGHREIVALGIMFDIENLPIEYKIKINDFLNRKGKPSSS